MSQNKTNSRPGPPLTHDVKIYGATIWGLRQFKRPWKDISRQIEIPMSTAKRYLSSYLKLIEDEPKIKNAMVQASQDIANLVGPSIDTYKDLIDKRLTHPTMAGHALSAARDVLKTHDIIKDKKFVEASIVQLDDSELESEYGELLRRRREATNGTGH